MVTSGATANGDHVRTLSGVAIGGQLGTGIEQTFDDYGQDQIALAAGLGGDHAIQAELASGH